MHRTLQQNPVEDQCTCSHLAVHGQPRARSHWAGYAANACAWLQDSLGQQMREGLGPERGKELQRVNVEPQLEGVVPV